METRLHDSAVSAEVSSHVPGQVHHLIDCWSALSMQNSKPFAKPPISMNDWQKVTGQFPRVFLGPQRRQRRHTVLPNSHYVTHTQSLIHPSLMWGIIRPSQTRPGFLWAARDITVGYFHAIKNNWCLSELVHMAERISLVSPESLGRLLIYSSDFQGDSPGMSLFLPSPILLCIAFLPCLCFLLSIPSTQNCALRKKLTPQTLVWAHNQSEITFLSFPCS